MFPPLMMSVKMPVLGLLVIKVFSNKDYDVIPFMHDVIIKNSSSDSDYIVDVYLTKVW